MSTRHNSPGTLEAAIIFFCLAVFAVAVFS